MEHGRKFPENGFLLVVLAILSVIVVILAGFVVAGFVNRGGENVGDSEVEEEETVITPEEEATYNAYMLRMEEVKAKAQEILSQEPVDVGALVELYTPVIDEYLAIDPIYAQQFILAENEDLMASGFKREALDELVRINYNVFPPFIQHRRYVQIVELAQELGDIEAVAQYEPLVVATQEAADQNQASIDRAKEEAEMRFQDEMGVDNGSEGEEE